jgi:hypothetical protein
MCVYQYSGQIYDEIKSDIDRKRFVVEGISINKKPDKLLSLDCHGGLENSNIEFPE